MSPIESLMRFIRLKHQCGISDMEKENVTVKLTQITMVQPDDTGNGFVPQGQ